jgi:hypothetical protein
MALPIKLESTCLSLNSSATRRGISDGTLFLSSRAFPSVNGERREKTTDTALFRSTAFMFSGISPCFSLEKSRRSFIISRSLRPLDV